MLTKAFGVAALVFALSTGWLVLELADSRTALATEQRDRSSEREAATSKALSDATRYRAIETHLEDVRNEATHVLTKTRAELGARADAHRADADGLRDQLTARLAGPAPGGATTDTLAACRADAAAAGELLEDGVRVQGALANATEHHAAEVRSLLDAWPVSTPAR